MFQSNSKYYLKSTIPSTLGTGGTFLISNDFELNSSLETGTDVVSLVLKNATQIERMTVTATAGTATIVKRGLTQASAKTEDASLRKQWNEGTVIVLTALASDLLDVDSSGGVSTIASDVEFTGNVTASKTIRVPSFADTTARDAAIPTPMPGMLVEIVGTGLQVYEGGIWNTLGFSTPTPNASDTVAGKVQTATNAQITGSVDVGSTSANLHVLPSQANKIVSLANADTAIAEDDFIVISDTSDGGKNKKILKSDLRESLAASATVKGTVEMATDAEVLAGTDQTRYVNPKQAKDNYWTTIFASDVIVAQSASWVNSTNLSYVKMKEITCNFAGSYRVSFTLTTNNNSVWGRVYKNDVALWTERSVPSWSSTFTEDFSFASGDKIQIYGKANSSTTVTISAFQVKATAFPTIAIPTVNI